MTHTVRYPDANNPLDMAWMTFCGTLAGVAATAAEAHSIAEGKADQWLDDEYYSIPKALEHIENARMELRAIERELTA